MQEAKNVVFDSGQLDSAGRLMILKVGSKVSDCPDF
jgi:hypothetical protein